MSMYKVSADGSVYGLVDTREAASKVISMRQTGRDGREITGSNSAKNTAKSSTLDYRIEEVADSEHPGFTGKK